MTYAAFSEGKTKDERDDFDRELVAWPDTGRGAPRGPSTGMKALMAAARMPQR